MAEKKDIPDELIDALLANYEKPDDLLGRNGILEQLTKRVVERALEAEMTHHLGHAKHGRVANADGNTRNVDFPERRGKILAFGDDGTAKSRGA